MLKQSLILILFFCTPLFAYGSGLPTPLEIQDSSQKIFQALNDNYNDHSHPDSAVSEEVRHRYKKDLLLLSELLVEVENGKLERARDVFIGIMNIVNSPVRLASNNEQDRNKLIEYKRTGNGCSTLCDIIIRELRDAIFNHAKTTQETLLIENLLLLVFKSPNDLRLTELIISAVSNPDLLAKVNVSQSSEIKNFLLLMTTHPSAQVRSWSLLGLGYFAENLDVRNLLIKTNMQEKVPLTFGKKELLQASTQVDAVSSLEVFSNNDQKAEWLRIYKYVYQNWYSKPFESKIQDYYDYDREYAVIKAAGNGILWKAVPNKKEGSFTYVRNGFPQILMSEQYDREQTKITSAPWDKVELKPTESWILMGMPQHKIEEGINKTLDTNTSFKLPYGSRSTVLSYLKYHLLHLQPPDSFFAALFNILGRIKQKDTANYDAYENSKTTSANEEVSVPTRLFAARAFALIGEAELASAELEKLFRDDLLNESLIPDWKEAVLWNLGQIQGNRKLIFLINTLTDPTQKAKYIHTLSAEECGKLLQQLKTQTDGVN